MSVIYKIKVGREHIARGKLGDAGSCPIALAVADAVPGATDVCVDDFEVEFVAGGERLVAELPGVAVKFISAFDSFRSREGLEPFEFEAVFYP